MTVLGSRPLSQGREGVGGMEGRKVSTEGKEPGQLAANSGTGEIFTFTFLSGRGLHIHRGCQERHGRRGQSLEVAEQQGGGSRDVVPFLWEDR